MDFKLIFFITGMICGSSAVADCELIIQRKECPGKAREALAPFYGINPTVEKKAVKDAKSCLEFAKKSCKVEKQDALAEKKVFAKLAGKSLSGGKNLCASVKESKSDCK
jgi:hypothetical protein